MSPFVARCLLAVATTVTANDQAAQPFFVKTLTGPTRPVSSVAADFGRLRAVSGSGDGTLKVWDLRTGECLHTLRGHTRLVRAVAADFGRLRAVSGSSDKSLKVWDLGTGECLHTLRGHTRIVWSVAADFDRLRAVSGSTDHTLKVWDLGTGQCLHTLRGHAGSVSSVAADFGRLRAMSGSGDGTLKVWDLGTGECLHTLQGHAGSVSSVAADFGRLRAMSGSGDGTLKVWDLGTGECLHTLQGHAGSVWSVAADFDRLRAVSGSKDHTLKVWDLGTGQCLHTLRGHTDWVRAVAADFRRLRAVSGSWDHTLKVWNITDVGPPCMGLVATEQCGRVTGCFLQKHQTPDDAAAENTATQPLGCYMREGQLFYNEGSHAGQTHSGSQSLCWPQPWKPVCTCPGGRAGVDCSYDGELKCRLPPPTLAQIGACVGLAACAALAALGLDHAWARSRAHSYTDLGVSEAEAKEAVSLLEQHPGALLLAAQSHASNSSIILAGLAVNARLVFPMLLAWLAPWLATVGVFRDMKMFLLVAFCTAPGLPDLACNLWEGRRAADIDLLDSFFPSPSRFARAVSCVRTAALVAVVGATCSLGELLPYPANALDQTDAPNIGLHQLQILHAAGLADQSKLLLWVALLSAIFAVLDIAVSLCPKTSSEAGMAELDKIKETAGDLVKKSREGESFDADDPEGQTWRDPEKKQLRRFWSSDEGVAKLCGAALAGGVLGLWALGSLRSARPGFQLRFGAADVGRAANISIESTAVLRVDPIHVPETDMGEVSWLWVALLAVMVALAAVMYHCASKLEARKRFHEVLRKFPASVLIEPDVVMLLADMALDLNSFGNYLMGSHLYFAGVSLAIWIFTFAKTCCDLVHVPQEFRDSLRNGFYTPAFIRFQRQEISVEGVASLLLSCYGLPWAVSSYATLTSQLVNIALSLRGVCKLVVLKELGI
ncbi:unnamed protein product [Effrenium voratum]|nr:unnamed protein product [Effrenium voratum]